MTDDLLSVNDMCRWGACPLGGEGEARGEEDIRAAYLLCTMGRGEWLGLGGFP